MQARTPSTHSTPDWFAINVAGFRRIQARNGLSFVVCELAQNIFDEVKSGVTEGEITLEPGPTEDTSILTATDNSPIGFRTLSDAWTVFAESYKADDPELRGRFNIGENQVLAMCVEATIHTTTGKVTFNAEGRHVDEGDCRERGTVFRAIVRMTTAEREETLRNAKRIIPPEGMTFKINGEVVTRPEAMHTFRATLVTMKRRPPGHPKAGELFRTRRATNVIVYETKGDDGGWVMEMGIPVVQTGDKWTYDVQQKVPVNTERNNIEAAYLTKLRSEALNALHSHLTAQDAAETWVTDAMESKDTTVEALQGALDARFGEDRVMTDPSDQEATSRAFAAGHTVVHGRQLSAGVRKRIKEIGKGGGPDLIPAAGRTKFKTPTPFKGGAGSEDVRVIPPERWKRGMSFIHDYAMTFARAVLGKTITVRYVSEISENFLACYGGNTLTLNLAKIGHRRLEDRSEAGQVWIDDLMIHELAHDMAPNHLSDEYHDACTLLGAKLGAACRKGLLPAWS